MSTLLFSYRDINIYEKERSFFCEGQWLNDVCINFSLKYFEEEELMSHALTNSFLFFDPAVVSFLNLQVDDEEEFEELARGLQLEQKLWLFVPLNDNSSFESSSTHWSLILCNVQTQEAFHLDSSNNYNQRAARALLQKISRLLKKPLRLQNLQVPQQENSFDCGVYAILFAQAAARFLIAEVDSIPTSNSLQSEWVKRLEIFIRSSVDAQSALSYRQFMLTTINALSKN